MALLEQVHIVLAYMLRLSHQISTLSNAILVSTSSLLFTVAVLADVWHFDSKSLVHVGFKQFSPFTKTSHSSCVFFSLNVQPMHYPS